MIKVGSIVVCRDSCSSPEIPRGTLTLNKAYTVGAKFGNMLKVSGVDKLVNISRFELLEEGDVINHKSDHNFIVGDVVECINAEGTACLKLGQLYVIEKVKVGGALRLKFDSLNTAEYNHSRFKRHTPRGFKAGDSVICVDNSHHQLRGARIVGLNIGRTYTISEVKDTGYLAIDGFVFLLEPSRFKLSSVKPSELESVGYAESAMSVKKDLIIVGSVVECIDDLTVPELNILLESGRNYVVTKVEKDFLMLDGFGENRITKCKFKVVVTNNPSVNTQKALYEKLEEFRGIGSFNEVIVNEGMYYCEADKTWKSKKEDSERWVFFIKGAWTMFNSRS